MIEQPGQEDLTDAILSANVPEFRPEMAYPLLTDEMVSRLKAYGEDRHVQQGTKLYGRGERYVSMYVVLQGSVTVYACDDAVQPTAVRTHNANEFTGELDLLSSQRTLVGARADTDSHVLQIDHLAFLQLMRAEGDIANLIMQATIWRRLGLLAHGTGGLQIIGSTDERDTVVLQRFLVRNSYPFRFLDPHSPGAQNVPAEMLYGAGPAVVLTDGRVLVRPSLPELADEIGLNDSVDGESVFDVTVVGAGPAGMAAAVYAASEGLSTLVVESEAPGGQAGTSSKIENYLGFPTGISGQRLAHRAKVQALKFGVRFALSREVVSARSEDGLHLLTLAGGRELRSRAVIAASGARYRTLAVPNYKRYEYKGIYYAATAMELLLCREKEVVVVGGGNSAGQAAIFLAGMAAHVHLLIRGRTAAATMSDYLLARIERSAHITVHLETEVTALAGDPALQEVTWTDRSVGSSITKEISNLFVMIGAEPNSGWLYGLAELDDKGFVVTGGEHAFDQTTFATGLAGLYAVGDIRSRSVKRVASAVGEGSVVISDVHSYLASAESPAPAPDSVLAAQRPAAAGR